MSEVFVTLTPFTVIAALAFGVALGMLLKGPAEVMLSVFLHNGHINLLLRIMPLFIVVFGSAIVVAFYVTAIATDIITGSDNNVYRAAGRGVGNLLFVWAVAIGGWIRVRNTEV